MNENGKRILKREISWKNFGFESNDPVVLGMPQCGRFQHGYVIYRGVWATFWLGFTVYDIATGSISNFHTYMSYWGLILITLCSVCQFLTSLQCYHKPHDVKNAYRTPMLFKVTWFLHNMSITAALFITTIYYSFVTEDREMSFSTVCIHTVNSVYALTELMLMNAIPVRLLHLWLPEVFGITYSLYNYLYWRTTSSEPVYDMLDYNTSPLLSLSYLVLVAFVICPLFHFAAFAVYNIKVLLHNQCLPSSDLIKTS